MTDAIEAYLFYEIAALLVLAAASHGRDWLALSSGILRRTF